MMVSSILVKEYTNIIHKTGIDKSACFWYTGQVRKSDSEGQYIMKKLLVLMVVIGLGFASMACNDASATGKAALNYRSLSGSGHINAENLSHQVQATLQQAMAANGFTNSSESWIRYEAKAKWSEDKRSVTLCVTAEDYRSLDKSDSLLPGGCVSVSSTETGVPDTVGIGLLPKAADKMAILMKNQIDGKAMPPAETSPPISPTNETVASPPTAPKAAANANTKK